MTALTAPSSQAPWVVFSLLNAQFAVSADFVREMIAMPPVVSMPNTPDHVRGMINLRGKILPVIDLRLRLGMQSLQAETDEIIQTLHQREKDHIHWITELELSVRERRPFKLAMNHHACAFGKWYDTFKTDNRVLETGNCLRRFAAPHEKIHAIAAKAKKLEEMKEYDAAYALIERTKQKEIAEMLALFAEVRGLFAHSNREIAMVLDCGGKTMAVSVDAVSAVEPIAASDIDAMPRATATADNDCIAGLAKRGKKGELVQLIDAGALVGQHSLAC